MKKSQKVNKLTNSFLQNVSLYFFKRPRKTALLCLALVLFGAVCYTTLLKKEGFPSINTPYAIAQGTFFVENSEKVDSDVATKLSSFLLSQDGVKSVQTQSFDNFFTGQVQYKDEVNAEQKTNELKSKLSAEKILPEQANIKFDPYKFGFTERGDDLVISFYSHEPVDEPTLISKANDMATALKDKNINLVSDVSIINPIEEAKNPVTGQTETAQRSFERFGKRNDGQNKFYEAIVIGVKSVPKADNLELYDNVNKALAEVKNDSKFSGYAAEISASNAPSIKAQISELQRTLLEGLVVVLVVGAIIIAVRASIVTVLSMISVLAITNGVLYLSGNSLNTITLFSLILALSLIVDDTIIMVEAIVAQSKKHKDPDTVISNATHKVSRAMIAATLTAALSFTPLIFVSGILGEFIRAIPITIISALLVSLFVALVFIPLFARLIIFKKNHSLKNANKHDFSGNIESKIAEFIAKPMLLAKNSKPKLAVVCVVAFLISFAFIGSGGYLFKKVKFNIFPSSKDSNQLSINAVFAPNTELPEAKEKAKEVEAVISKVVGDNLVTTANNGFSNAQNAYYFIDLTDYKDRKVTSQQIIKDLSSELKNVKDVQIKINQIDAGPPASGFTVKVETVKDRQAAIKLANDIQHYLSTLVLQRSDGSKAEIESVSPPNPGVYSRSNNKPYVSVTAQYKDSDTTALFTLTEKALKDKFTPEKVASYGLDKDAMVFDLQQEGENQDSFKTLAIAFPAVLLVIYVLLVIQFRSFLQPILIFMAIPFSLFGIALGLYLSDNPFSFFAMLGFFALIGLSIKNTILLTDYANQARAAGKRPVDAIHEALAERFRPLIATSLTAVVSLIPLAITSPFWEGLSVVLIFGLLSSTFLVIIAFPYYYLAAEFLRIYTKKSFQRIFR